MCGIGQVLSTGFQMFSAAAEAQARIEEQNRQYEANKKAAESSYEAAVDTTDLSFVQNQQKIRQQQLDFELLGKIQIAQLEAQAGASNLRGSSVRNTISDAKAKISKDTRRFEQERQNLADAYTQELENLAVTKENQINTVSQGRWTLGDSLGVMAPMVSLGSQMMINQQNAGYSDYRNLMIGQQPGFSGYSYGSGGYSGQGPFAMGGQPSLNIPGL